MVTNKKEILIAHQNNQLTFIIANQAYVKPVYIAIQTLL